MDACRSILPGMTPEEALELTKLYSVSGLLRNRSRLFTTRPFRAPHHTVSAVALVGGGSIPRPGEVSLAQCGVLFLNEEGKRGFQFAHEAGQSAANAASASVIGVGASKKYSSPYIAVPRRKKKTSRLCLFASSGRAMPVATRC